MVKERHCSREVSELLCKKGFAQGTDLRMTRHLAFYDNEGLRYDIDRWYDSMVTENVPFVIAPTHQMACDWLMRLGIYICPTYCSFQRHKKYDPPCCKWEPTILSLSSSAPLYPQPLDRCEHFDTFGEAVDFCIKYALENLV